MENILMGTLIGLVLGGGIAYVIARSVFNDKLKMINDKNTEVLDLKGFKDEIAALKGTTETIQQNIAQDRGSLKEMLSSMNLSKAEMVKVANELKTTLVAGGNQTQGNWGQLVIEHILQDRLGMTKGVEFSSQKGFSDEGGTQIPDIIVHLPGGRDVIVDSKVSLKAWDEYSNATDAVARQDALDRHIKSIKTHIMDLSKKNYQKLLNIKTLDAVIMFVPNEHAITSLGKDSREITDFALTKKITIVGPSMIYYVLKTVDQFWKVEKQNKNIQEVIRLATKTYDKAYGVYSSAQKAAKSFGQMDAHIQDVLKKIQDGSDSLLGAADKMKKIGGLNTKNELSASEKAKVDDDHIPEIGNGDDDDPDPDDNPPAAARIGR